MKTSRTKIILTLALALAGGLGAWAQSNQVPGAEDYAAFSKFITDRNIFDPNRQPHYTSRTRPRTPRTRSPSAPAFTFVGTMSYDKGLFAFFSGNSADLKKVLPVMEKIAGYTVTEISHSRVKLESADKKQKVEMKVGDLMRQENGKWEMAGAGELPSGTNSTETTGATGGGNSAAASPSSSSEPNEVLKRLMQLREQESK
jgi:hypothetical protein